jgi:fatty acyl-CoA reductase
VAPLKVYHVATSVANPLTNAALAAAVHRHFAARPFLDKRGRPIAVRPLVLFDSAPAFSAAMEAAAAATEAEEERAARGGEPESAGTAAGRGSGAAAVALAPPSASVASATTAARRRALARSALDQLHYLAGLYTPYTFYSARHDASNTAALRAALTPSERAAFDFDLTAINWDAYIADVHVPGLRHYVLKDRKT